MASARPIPAPRWKIPPFESAWSVLSRHASSIAPKEPLTVSQWAIRHADYDPEVMPSQIEIMDALSDPETAEVGYMASVQVGKSEIGLLWIGWSIDHDPTDMLVCQADQKMAQDFVQRRVDPMIDRVARIKARLAPVGNANAIFQKVFRGMLLSTIWPVAAQFASRPVARGWIDELDLIDDDIDGKGSAPELLDGRQTTFEGRDTKFISSSPAHDKGGGIEAFVEAGTDERLQPVCPQCGDRFEPDLIRDLRFDQNGTADDAERTAHVVCPVNGCVLEPSERLTLIASLAALPHKGWVPSRPQASKRRRTFRQDGLLSFRSWPALARQWREADIAWATLQDETKLRVFWNTRAGKNYRAKSTGEKPIDADHLAKRLEGGWKRGQLPHGARVVVVTVDVQRDRFEVLVIAYGDNLESWIVDRYPIDVLPDGLTTIRPFRHPEHWQVLLPLFTKGWELADGSGRTVPALTVAIDTGGGDTAGDDSALKFWHAARALGVHPSRITLLKGASSHRGALMPQAQFSDRKMGGGAKRGGPKLFLPNVHSIKGIIDHRLRREVAGPGYIHLPEWLAPKVDGRSDVRDHAYLDEMTCERLVKGKWEKQRPRNETWDLLVYSYAALLRPPFAQSRAHMRWVPADFRVPEFEVAEVSDQRAETEIVATALARKPIKAKPASPAKPKRPPAGKAWVKPRSDWINRR